MKTIGKFYLCPNCDKEAEAKEWDKSTFDFYQDDVESIEEKHKNSQFFVCPLCNSEVDGDSVHLFIEDGVYYYA